MQCPKCRRLVLWTTTEAGKRLAVDIEPDVEGNTAVYRNGTGTWVSRRPTDELPVMRWERLHKPHVATCPGPMPRHGRPVPPVLPPGVADMSAYRRKARGRP
ncbi:hypothetical protein HUT18_11885 [Streptomyces sp. NA04227]|uniref:hypothetical protein n=1 Tax=Streptomyces sp. NA04227 TaxID=2742136 RepID=UPI0015905EA2|nr:hypothetical protein [Streptomyces sp. NA04227]QKW06998.1 hypothetical protein HUT18_11885 [Streptomyces sp. NA04227]